MALRYDSLASSSQRLRPCGPRPGEGLASLGFIRSKSIPNDFVSFMTFLSSMFVNNEFAVHYHSPDVLISPPISSGLSFVVRRYRIQRDEDRIRINKDRVLGKGSEIVLKSPRITVNANGIITEEARFNAIIREVRILTHKHFDKNENLVQLLGISWQNEPDRPSLTMPVLVIEYGSHGTLIEYFMNYGPIPMQQKLQLALGIVEGLLALHGAHVVHADVKAANVIVYKSEGQVIAKVADFGSAILLDDIPDGQMYRLPVFSRFWNAPEYQDPISKAALPAIDAYSFGLVFWQLILELEDPFQQSIFLATASPGDSDGFLDTEMRHQLVQNTKYRANDEFLDVAWQTLLQAKQDMTVTEMVVLRQVFSNTLRRESSKRDLPSVRYYLSEQAAGRNPAAPTPDSLANERYRHRSSVFVFGAHFLPDPRSTPHHMVGRMRNSIM
jgi:serine/threonine protein kinase